MLSNYCLVFATKNVKAFKNGVAYKCANKRAKSFKRELREQIRLMNAVMDFCKMLKGK